MANNTQKTLAMLMFRKPRPRELELARNLHIVVQGNEKAEKTIVLLHGIASSQSDWQRVIPRLGNKYRIVLVDLLGFGKSPVPLWANYTVDTHAKAVIMSLQKRGISGPFTLVGHSMGCIIGTHIAALSPELVEDLYLISPPIYKGWELYDRSISVNEYLIHKLYFGLYNYFCGDFLFTTFVGNLLTKIIGKPTSFNLGTRNFIAFQRSLRNCIEFQHMEEEITALTNMDVHIYYGVLDLLIIKRYIKQLDEVLPNIKVSSIPLTGHIVNARMAESLVKDLRREATV